MANTTQRRRPYSESGRGNDTLSRYVRSTSAKARRVSEIGLLHPPSSCTSTDFGRYVWGDDVAKAKTQTER